MGESVATKVVDYLNDTPGDKFREVTIITPLQGEILPLLDVIGDIKEIIVKEVAYRNKKHNKEKIKKEDIPERIDYHALLVKRIAQWQKSVLVKGENNFTRQFNLAMIELQGKDEYGTGAMFNEADQWEQ